MLSWSLRNCLIILVIRFVVYRLKHRTGLYASISLWVIIFKSFKKSGSIKRLVERNIYFMLVDETKATISTLYDRWRYFFVIAPAVTRPTSTSLVVYSLLDKATKILHTYGLPGTTSVSTATGFDTVLLKIHEIGMAGARVEVHCLIAIIIRPLVFISYY